MQRPVEEPTTITTAVHEVGKPMTASEQEEQPQCTSARTVEKSISHARAAAQRPGKALQNPEIQVTLLANAGQGG